MKNNVDLEYVNCELCGKDETILVYTERDLNIVECRHCGLVYVNPRFSEKTYKDKSSLDYTKLATESLITSGLKSFAEKKCIERSLYIKSRTDESRFYLKAMEKFTRGRGKLLDVGCGEGFFLKAARDKGWEVTGVEISPNHIPPPDYGLNIINEDILRADLKEGSFDVITFYDVMEHMPHPGKVLDKTMALLKKGGLLVIRVPNEKFLRIKMRLFTSIFGRDFYLKNDNLSIMGYYAPETHLYDFNQKTIGLFLRNKGFNILKIQPGKFAAGAGTIRFLVHHSFYFISKAAYYISAGKINYNCSMSIYAQKKG